MKTMDDFLKDEIKVIENLGFKVKVVRLGDWPLFHVIKEKRKDAFYPLPSHDTVEILIKNSVLDKRKKHYHLQIKELFDKRNYTYDDFEKFKKGFQRNVMKYFREIIR